MNKLNLFGLVYIALVLAAAAGSTWITDEDGNVADVRTNGALLVDAQTATITTNWNAYALTGTVTEASQALGQNVKDTVIVNDGSAVLLVGFNTSTTNKAWRLKSGDIFSTGLQYSNLYYKTTSGTAVFRLFVGW